MNPIAVIFHTDRSPVDTKILTDLLEIAPCHADSEIYIWEAEGIAIGQHWLPVLPEDLEVKLPVVHGKLVIFAEARIDNRPELLKELRLTSTQIKISDIELILFAYEKFGEDCPNHLIGAYTFVVWDQEQRRLFCARDVMGIRTLYYARTNKTICISTLARQCAHHPDIPDHINDEFLLLWMMGVYQEKKTIFTKVESLARGHTLTISNGYLKVAQYWDWSNLTVRSGSIDLFVDEFRELLLRAVQDRCRTTQSVIGCHTSGGMDSTSVTAMAARVAGQEKTILPYSFRFDQLTDCDESAFSIDVARYLGLPEPRWIDVEKHWILKDAFTDTSLSDFPFPFFSARDSHTMKMFEHEGGNVFLTGVAGDNLTMGFPHRKILSAKLWRGDVRCLPGLWQDIQESSPNVLHRMRTLATTLPPYQLTQAIKEICQSTPGRFSWIPSGLYRDYALRKHFVSSNKHFFPELERQWLFEMVDESFRNKQRTIQYLHELGSVFGVEARHPLFDQRLVAFVLSMPVEWLRIGGIKKGFLRRSMDGYLPSTVLNRREKPSLGAMYHAGITQELEAIQSILSNSLMAQRNLIDEENLLESIKHFVHKESVKTPAQFLYTLGVELFLRRQG